MISKICRSRYLALCLTLAFLAGAAQLRLPTVRAEEPTGHLTVTGMVKVNGKPAATGDIVSAGSTVETVAKSSAVVSLGKLGRVEVMPDSTMKLSFDNSGIKVGMLEAGRVRVSSSSGSAASAETGNGRVVAVGREANKFTVDTKCGSTYVATEEGIVELHSRVITRVPAGSDVEVGTPKEGCTR